MVSPRQRVVLNAIVMLSLGCLTGTAEARRPACLARAENSYNIVDFQRAKKVLRRCIQQVTTDRDRACVRAALGLILMELHKSEAAKEEFARALILDPAACGCSRVYKQEFIKRCLALRAEMKGTLVVRSNCSGAKVLVDGLSRGKAPATIKLPIGDHEVTLQLSGGQRKSRKVQVLFQRKLRVTVDCPVEKEPEPRRGSRIWTWVAAGVALAAAGVATGVWFAGDAQYSDWETLAAQEKSRTLTADEEQQLFVLQDSVEGKEATSYALWSIAGAAAVSAAVLFFIEGRGAAETAAPRASFFPLLGHTTGLGARFDF